MAVLIVVLAAASFWTTQPVFFVGSAAPPAGPAPDRVRLETPASEARRGVPSSRRRASGEHGARGRSSSAKSFASPARPFRDSPSKAPVPRTRTSSRRSVPIRRTSWWSARTTTWPVRCRGRRQRQRSRRAARARRSAFGVEPRAPCGARRLCERRGAVLRHARHGQRGPRPFARVRRSARARNDLPRDDRLLQRPARQPAAPVRGDEAPVSDPRRLHRCRRQRRGRRHRAEHQAVDDGGLRPARCARSTLPGSCMASTFPTTRRSGSGIFRP